MIFLILFAIIVIIIVALNIYDSSNLEKIKEYFKKNNCQNIIYAKGVYKGICDDKIIQIKNSFLVDLEQNRTSFKLSEIKQLDEKKLSIVINKNYKIEFKEEKNREIFYKDLKEKIKILY